MSGTDDLVVEVDGLAKRYAGRLVLDRIAFTVRRGELVALVGPNGAGKTTTVESLEGYRRRDGGRVRVLGLDPDREAGRLRPRLGLMLQGGGFPPLATASEIVRLFAAFFRTPEDPDRLLDLVGLDAVRHGRYRTLSGGERQRLALAVALVGRPELLILDEPTAGMDPEAKERTRRLLADLRAAGRTILLTTHELTDVERLADRVLVIDRGRIVAEGPPAEVGLGIAPRLRFRLAAALATDDLGHLRQAVERAGRRVVELVDEGAGWYRVEGVAPDPRLVAAVATWCAERGALIVELRTAGGTLEERYLELVEGGRETADG